MTSSAETPIQFKQSEHFVYYQLNVKRNLTLHHLKLFIANNLSLRYQFGILVQILHSLVSVFTIYDNQYGNGVITMKPIC